MCMNVYMKLQTISSHKGYTKAIMYIVAKITVFLPKLYLYQHKRYIINYFLEEKNVKL